MAEFRIGDRVRLIRDVENYPTIYLDAGESGTLVSIGEDSWWVKLDQHHAELAEWDNEIQIWDFSPENPERDDCHPSNFMEHI